MEVSNEISLEFFFLFFFFRISPTRVIKNYFRIILFVISEVEWSGKEMKVFLYRIVRRFLTIKIVTRQNAWIYRDVYFIKKNGRKYKETVAQRVNCFLPSLKINLFSLSLSLSFWIFKIDTKPVLSRRYQEVSGVIIEEGISTTNPPMRYASSFSRSKCRGNDRKITPRVIEGVARRTRNRLCAL